MLLYRGFNIGLLRNDTGQVLKYGGFYDDKFSGEATAYLPYTQNDTLALPAKLRVTYTGAFPIYTDTLNSFDFKGLIAFNGKTVRAAEQSKWYPVIYDVKNDRELLEVTYDIEVTCKDCQTIYINGSAPQAGPSGKFHSTIPRQLLLFAGNYVVQALPNSTFLNADLSADEAAVFNENIGSIINFYRFYLQVPYGEKITFMQHRSVEPFGPKRSWGFVTFPTIAVAGKPFKSEIDTQKRLFKNIYSYYFYSHELGHYYYGQSAPANSTLKWFFLESMAEFLSIKAAENKYGKEATQKYIAERKPLMKDWKVKPLSQISSPNQIGDGYRYTYAPMILLAMEKNFGSKTVQRFCRNILQNAGQRTDYPFLVKMVKSAGVNDKDWKAFEATVMEQTECNKIFDHLP
ncbi:hypothetical protein LLH06_19220 [Mucilaginibacter daejeonensis]|uniref:hypothetical protein n=1 Tax=Mucilaginibacter daejeonensis TaxID=398049 RepID=UPI001D170894|nr:hypothetical protein [Mucilaginibacter daejeonensis]UEG53078.1 hypothetical protein LLH06_19220 [Mucilaginibacter daejeonensis]